LSGCIIYQETMSAPPSPQNRQITLDGLTFHITIWDGNGPNVVLLHGLASNRKIWDLVGPILAHTTSVVAIDQRGHGESDKPATGYDFTTITHDLHLLLKYLGLIRPIIIGHSWGGNVALDFASTYPQEVGGIVLLDGGLIEISHIPNNSLKKALIDMAPPIVDGLTMIALQRRLQSRNWHSRDQTSREAPLEDIIIANFQVQDDNRITARLPRKNHLQIIKALWDHHPTKLLPELECPVLLMPARYPKGAAETPAIAQLARKEATIAAAEKLLTTYCTVWLEDSIHDVPLQKPELVASVVLHHIQRGIFHSN